MKTFDKKQQRQLGVLLPVIRGLLARSSGSEDNPWHRAILHRLPKRGAGRKSEPVIKFSIDSLSPNCAPDELRSRTRTPIQWCSIQSRKLPSRILLDRFGAFQCERPKCKLSAPLSDRVALVTGAGGAIGAAICRGLMEKGCRVAATDIAADSLREVVEELKKRWPDKVIGVPLDVTDKVSVADGFARAACEWGGVDIVVVNAGIAMVSPLMEMDVDAFRRLEKVNVEGTLLTIAEAGRHLVRQGTGGDIVVVSTKNVFAPGAQFGAYSATKAASHQLARIASLEFAPFDIRVNMVAPDAVFSDGKRKSGLWAEVGPSRMKARGLDEKGLEEYYRNRNLLKARVTGTHVANAVLFFATRQTPTTGATIPVDGGLPDATPR